VAALTVRHGAATAQRGSGVLSVDSHVVGPQAPDKGNSYDGCADDLVSTPAPPLKIHAGHVSRLTIRNVSRRTALPDRRPAIICDDAQNLELSGVQVHASASPEPLVLLHNAGATNLDRVRSTGADRPIVRQQSAMLTPTRPLRSVQSGLRVSPPAALLAPISAAPRQSSARGPRSGH
jgi:hypothetical protein